MPDKKLTDSEIVKALDEAELFLRNRVMDGKPLKLNEYDIGILRNISQVCAKAYDEINRLQAENETLQDVVKQNHLIRNNGKSPLSLIKAEAYEEFIDKFLEKAISTRNYFEIKSLARTVLKELVGDGGCDTCKSLTCDGCELYEELVGEDDASKD